jgi:hypothetical protein
LNEKINELERMCKEAVVAYYPGIWLEELRKTMKTSVRIVGLQAKI